MEECRTDFINHIRVCLSLCVCVCVSIFDSRFLTPIYLFRIYTTVENKYSHRTRSIRISESKEIDGGIFIRMESIDRTVSEKSRDGLNSSRFLNSILADLLSFDSNFAISKSFRVSPLDFDFFFIIRREIREFSFFKEGGGGNTCTLVTSRTVILNWKVFGPTGKLGRRTTIGPTRFIFSPVAASARGNFLLEKRNGNFSFPSNKEEQVCRLSATTHCSIFSCFPSDSPRRSGHLME